MPWIAADAESHFEGLSDSQREEWAEVANAVREKLLSQGKSEREADAEAVKAANAAMKKEPPEGAARSTPELTVPKKLTTESLNEYVDNRGVKLTGIDREKGIISGVKILGPESANGNTYPPSTLRESVSLYEGAKVNVDHAGTPAAPRSYRDRIGSLRNVQLRPEGLFADFHFNPKHPLSEQLLWDAERSPENVGFSHNVDAGTRMLAGRKVVEEIRKVCSVDLVSDPATTGGLFEQKQKETAVKTTIKKILESVAKKTKGYSILEDMGAAVADVPVEVAADESADDQIKKAFRAAVVAVLDDESMDVQAQKDKIASILDAQAGLTNAETAADDAATEALRKDNANLREQVEQYKSAQAVDKLLTESKLPDRLKTPAFRRVLLEAKTDQARKELIDDRRLMVTESSSPLSREQVLEGEPTAEKSGFDQGKAYADHRLAQMGKK